MVCGIGFHQHPKPVLSDEICEGIANLLAKVLVHGSVGWKKARAARARPIALSSEVIDLSLEGGSRTDPVEWRRKLDDVTATNQAIKELLVGGPKLRRAHPFGDLGRDIKDTGPELFSVLEVVRPMTQYADPSLGEFCSLSDLSEGQKRRRFQEMRATERILVVIDEPAEGLTNERSSPLGRWWSPSPIPNLPSSSY